MSLQLAAKHLATKGRGPDTELVHMTKGEVRSLQHLAKAHGGTLTINPHTGLPEAGFLSSILPVVAGAASTYFTGSPYLGMALAGAYTYEKSGSLSKGLMAGMSAYGGGEMVSGLGGLGTSEAGANVDQALEAQQNAAVQDINAKIAASSQEAGQLAPELTQAQIADIKNQAAQNFTLPDDVQAKITAAAQNPYQAGLSAAINDPSKFITQMGGKERAAKMAMLAAAPAITAAMAPKPVNAAAPTPIGPGNRYSFTSGFDPVTGKYVKNDQYNVLSLDEAKQRYGYAAGGDVQGDDQGDPNRMQVKSFEPVVRMAVGGPSYSYDPTTQKYTALTQPIENAPAAPILPSGRMADASGSGPTTGTAPSNGSGAIASGALGLASSIGLGPAVGLAALASLAMSAINSNPSPESVPVSDISWGPVSNGSTSSDTAPSDGAGGGGPGDGGTSVNGDAGISTGVGGDGISAGDGMGDGVSVAARGGLSPHFSYRMNKGGLSNLDPSLFDGMDKTTALELRRMARNAPTKPTTADTESMKKPKGLRDMAGLSDMRGLHETAGLFAHGGLSAAHYNLGGYSDGGRLLKGPGDGVSDSIPATIGNKRPARLADGEFVVPARIVSELGNGSTEAGARRLYAMMDRVQKARGKTVGKGKIAKNTNAARYLPA